MSRKPMQSEKEFMKEIARRDAHEALKKIRSQRKYIDPQVDHFGVH